MKTFLAALVCALVSASAFGQAAPASNIDQMLQPNAGPSASQGVIGVVLAGNGVDAKLDPETGSIGTTYAFVTALIFADFPGLHATVQTPDGRPVLHVLMGGDPNGRVFIVRVNSNERTSNRSVKIGKAGFASYSGISVPDPDWTIPYTAQQTKPGYWTLTPNVPMKPGEYGLYVTMGTIAGGTTAPGGTLYGFSVSASPAVAARVP